MLKMQQNTANIGAAVIKFGVLEAANFQPPNHNEQERFAMAAPILTQARLKELLHYDPDTGLFTWLPRGLNFWDAHYAGKVAGSRSGRGYVQIRILERMEYAHRLAFLYMVGKYPEFSTDHINGIITDNRWCNLRSVTQSENNKNMRTPKDNTSGVMGVFWGHRLQKWQPAIRVNRKQYHLGCYSDWFDAVCARKSAENRFGFHPNHGRRAGR